MGLFSFLKGRKSVRTWRYHVRKTFVTFTNGIQFGTSFFPPVIVGNPRYQLKGDEQRVVLKLLRSGDLLLRRYNGSVSNFVIDGHYSHVAMAENRETVAHALIPGVVEEDVLTFMRCDDILIARVTATESEKRKAVKVLRSLVGTKYDFLFDSSKKSGHDHLYCTETCWRAWEHVLGPVPEGKPIHPMELLDLPQVEILHDSRQWRREQKQKENAAK